MRSSEAAVDSMLSMLALDEAGIAARLALTGLAPPDFAALDRLHAILGDIGQAIATRFSQHLHDFPATRRFVASPRRCARVADTLDRHFRALTAGDYGIDYVRDRIRTGLHHRRIGLEKRWYLGAYARYLGELLAELQTRLAHPEHYRQSVQALFKIALFDIGLTVDAHRLADRPSTSSPSTSSFRDYAELMFASTPHAVLVLDQSLCVEAANPAFLRLFDLSPETLLGHPLLDFVSAEGFSSLLAEVRPGEPIRQQLLTIARIDGSHRVPAKVIAIASDPPEHARRLLCIEDLSEQARLQQALQESEERLQHAQEAAHLGSWQIDFPADKIRWSPETYRIFGLPPDTPIQPDTPFGHVHPGDREMVIAAWQAALLNGHFQVRHRLCSAQQVRWVEAKGEILRAPDGTPLQAHGSVQDITEQQAAKLRIERLAFYDALTELPNRALCMERLKHELAAAARQARKLSLLFLDLDRFKDINDTLGHDTGDRVLQEVAARLRQCLRAEEMLARLSGDEFVIVTGGTGEATSSVLERIGRALATPIAVQEHRFNVAASTGIAVFPDDGSTPDELLKNADIAMYRAKGSGGGYRFYQAQMGYELTKKLLIAQKLAAAPGQGHLALHFQPQVHLKTRALIGAEALMRWHDPEWQEVPPITFIPIAEERGLISTLGEWSLHQTCRQLRAWQAAGWRGPERIAVNVAAQQLDHADCVERFRRILREHGVGAERIELELTESGMMRDPDRAVEIARELSALGFALAIDDFGTGYSSLSHLKRFPVDKLKIDISFVRDMLADQADHAIVSTIIGMGRTLKLKTLAEGVEHPAQAQKLRTLGCHFAQGWYFGHALPAAEFARQWLMPATVLPAASPEASS